MKKIVLRVSAVLFLSFQLSVSFAQAPQKMSYQAVVRNASNALVTSSPVGMQVSILQGSATGTAVYVETQSASTNVNGLVTIEIGNGTPVSGTFAAIDWSAGPYFIMTETDPAGGTTYTITGTTQLMSVPYALYAETSGTGGVGATGATGANGVDGATGATGADGINGIDGAAGATGAAGIDGTNGIDGATGTAGTNGIDGATGATGSTGAMGPMGPMGMGMPGSPGMNGATGATGTAGTNGTAGATGMTGSTGSTGAMGPMGPMGMGMPGSPGTNGATGATGTAGTNGTNGTTGVTGATGVTGTAGADGILPAGSAAGNTPYWDGAAWITNNSNIYNNGGNIGIGTVTPAYKLDISDPGNTIVRAKANGTNSFVSFILSNPERDFMMTNNAGDDLFSIYYGSANRLQFSLTNQWFNSGNVGIGTATPNAALQFANVLTNRRIVLWEDANNDHQFYGFGINGNILRYQVAAASQNHVFYAGSGTTTSLELMRIQGDGNVGIGTSAPSAKLEVAGKTKINGQLEITTTTGAVLLPRLTTTERTALTAVPGMMIYNTSTGKFQGYATGLGVEALDQSMTAPNTQLTSTSVGQTFIAGATGELSKIDVTISTFTAAGSFTLNVYAGTGTGGALLGSLTGTISAAGIKSFVLTGINVTAGNTYTFTMFHSANCSWSMDNTNSYPSGSLFTGMTNISWDLWFKTYVKPAVNSWVDFH
ncbi:MAG: hypothetical protein JWO44_630 [Bacteroidetes bacterium]|nr:hypothetical protein [Bacteroidota bacterium]